MGRFPRERIFPLRLGAFFRPLLGQGFVLGFDGFHVFPHEFPQDLPDGEHRRWRGESGHHSNDDHHHENHEDAHGHAAHDTAGAAHLRAAAGPDAGLRSRARRAHPLPRLLGGDSHLRWIRIFRRSLRQRHQLLHRTARMPPGAGGRFRRAIQRRRAARRWQQSLVLRRARGDPLRSRQSVPRPKPVRRDHRGIHPAGRMLAGCRSGHEQGCGQESDAPARPHAQSHERRNHPQLAADPEPHRI